LAALVRSSDDAIIGKSPTGAVVFCNKAAERLYGYGAAEMLAAQSPQRRNAVITGPDCLGAEPAWPGPRPRDQLEAPNSQLLVAPVASCLVCDQAPTLGGEFL
jgi:PAS domain-containing protein